MGITHVYSPDGSGIPGVHVCPQWFSRRRSLSRAISCDGDLRSPSSGRSGPPLFANTDANTHRDSGLPRTEEGEWGSGFFSMTEHRPPGAFLPISSLPFTFRPRVHYLSKIRTLERLSACLTNPGNLLCITQCAKYIFTTVGSVYVDQTTPAVT